MVWFRVGEAEGVPVFLTHEMFREVKAAALRDWSPIERVSSEIPGEWAHKADLQTKQYLNDWYRRDRADFEARFGRVTLAGESAQRNATNILGCFLGLHRCGLMKRVVSPSLLVFQDMVEIGSAHFPMGRVFEVCHFGRRERWWDQFFQRRRTSLLLRLNDLRLLHGNLQEFVFGFESCSVKFTAQSIEVIGVTSVKISRSGTHIGCDAHAAAMQEELEFLGRLRGARSPNATEPAPV
jgi:hypothetical protein